MQEETRQDYFWSSIAFGQPLGWWLVVESFRQLSPWIYAQRNEVLISSGYRSAILEMEDGQHPDLHTQNIFIAQSHQVASAMSCCG